MDHCKTIEELRPLFAEGTEEADKVAFRILMNIYQMGLKDGKQLAAKDKGRVA